MKIEIKDLRISGMYEIPKHKKKNEVSIQLHRDNSFISTDLIIPISHLSDITSNFTKKFKITLEVQSDEIE